LSSPIAILENHLGTITPVSSSSPDTVLINGCSGDAAS
jgi:hypothetical protein